jgi:fumarate reductase flavoprotein subunit
MRAGATGPNGGVYLAMGHLGPDFVRRQFKGTVERCADCGLDRAAGRVEVVPTAHYMMGGVEFAPDCTTGRPGRFVVGEDSGGVHGANRLGGNGVANSTVFGGIAGETIAAWIAREGAWRDPDPAALDAAVARAEAPFAGGSVDATAAERIRERLHTVMWDDAGIVRNAASLGRAADALSGLEHALAAVSLPADGRAFKLTWHDWLNLANLIAVSQAIVRAGLAREDSRGAHFRDDHPETGELAALTFVRVRQRGASLCVDAVAVRFNRVRPGESLLAS